TQRLAAWFGALNSVTCRGGTEWVIHATGAVVGRGTRHEFLQGVPRLAPSGKDIRDGFYGRRSHLSEFYIASRHSLNSLPLSFEKISCFVQLPDKLFDLRNRWSANLMNNWRDIPALIGPKASSPPMSDADVAPLSHEVRGRSTGQSEQLNRELHEAKNRLQAETY